MDRDVAGKSGKGEPAERAKEETKEHSAEELSEEEHSEERHSEVGHSGEDEHSGEEDRAENVLEKIPALLGKLPKRYWAALILIALIVFLLVITWQVHAAPLTLKAYEKSIRSNVEEHFRGQLRSQLANENPQLGDEEINRLLDKQWPTYRKQNKKQIDSVVKENFDRYKEPAIHGEGKENWPYLGDIDSYYWLRQARNIIESGRPCDEVEEGRCYDTYTMAPQRRELIPSLHPYAIATVYRLLTITDEHPSLMKASFYVPVLLSALMVVPFFISLRRVAGRSLSATIAAAAGVFLLGINNIFLSRTMGSDSDIYNVFLPVIILWLVIEAFTSKNRKRMMLFAGLSGLFFGIYSLFWVGFSYLFVFVLIAKLSTLGYRFALSLISEKFSAKKSKPWFVPWLRAQVRNAQVMQSLILLVVFVLSTFVFVSLLSGPSNFFDIPQNILGFQSIKNAANPNVWPNVLTTVAEFNPASLRDAVTSMGSTSLLGLRIDLYLFALLGILFLLYPSVKHIRKYPVSFLIGLGMLIYLSTSRATSLSPMLYYALLLTPLAIATVERLVRRDERFDPSYALLAVVWLIASIYASLKGVRFVLLLVVPLAFCAGIGIGGTFRLLYRYVSWLVSLALGRRSRALVKAGVFILLAVVLIMMLYPKYVSARSMAEGYVSMVNDQWVDALERIKNDSRPDAIINSWWDFGHWFKYWADRRVTLDGSSQNKPQLHWLGKMLLTGNENESVGILRMLDCGGNQAYDTLLVEAQDAALTIDLLNALLVMNRAEAQDYLLEQGISDSVAEQTLAFTHCEPPENYLITSADMAGKAAVWSHFGLWDFKRAYLSLVHKQRNRQEVLEHYERLYGMSPEQTRSWMRELDALESTSDVNAWIAPWPGYAGGTQRAQLTEEGFFLCPLGEGFIFVNTTSREAAVRAQDGIRNPDVLVFADERGALEKRYREASPDRTLGISVAVFGSGGDYGCLLGSPEVIPSMFTRLFFMNGIGLQHFEKFFDIVDYRGIRIIVWKVRWPSVGAV